MSVRSQIPQSLQQHELEFVELVMSAPSRPTNATTKCGGLDNKLDSQKIEMFG